LWSNREFTSTSLRFDHRDNSVSANKFNRHEASSRLFTSTGFLANDSVEQRNTDALITTDGIDVRSVASTRTDTSGAIFNPNGTTAAQFTNQARADEVTMATLTPNLGSGTLDAAISGVYQGNGISVTQIGDAPPVVDVGAATIGYQANVSLAPSTPARLITPASDNPLGLTGYPPVNIDPEEVKLPTAPSTSTETAPPAEAKPAPVAVAT
jgi:hypothetical protein